MKKTIYIASLIACIIFTVSFYLGALTQKFHDDDTIKSLRKHNKDLQNDIRNLDTINIYLQEEIMQLTPHHDEEEVYILHEEEWP